MKKIAVILIFFIHISLGFSQSLERQVINSFGNAVVASGLYFEHNGGEVITQSLNAGGIWLLQGFLQPSKESVGLPEEAGPVISCPTPAPVPFENTLELMDNHILWERASLHDAGGRLIWQRTMPSNTLSGLPEGLAEGMYVLKLHSGSGTSCVYKLLHKRL
ncbi:MAG: hypothetical protein N2050_10155 [Flavobacteriales bacterium]|nr:hypothetical protein [Flavobacteriales bacterium]MCX7650894.1 hypothetical protein [Flavobacteriales bacterium]MDW8431943.1 hypothetical protein [Flavobacteriales bacterium]